MFYEKDQQLEVPQKNPFLKNGLHKTKMAVEQKECKKLTRRKKGGKGMKEG